MNKNDVIEVRNNGNIIYFSLYQEEYCYYVPIAYISEFCIIPCKVLCNYHYSIRIKISNGKTEETFELKEFTDIKEAKNFLEDLYFFFQENPEIFSFGDELKLTLVLNILSDCFWRCLTY